MLIKSLLSVTVIDNIIAGVAAVVLRLCADFPVVAPLVVLVYSGSNPATVGLALAVFIFRYSVVIRWAAWWYAPEWLVTFSTLRQQTEFYE